MILLVEDSPILRRAITRALYREVDIATANDGEEAWEAICALPEIDVVVTELAMPLLDGHGLLARIRTSASPRCRTMPVIVLSDAEQPEARRRALAAGADDYLIKPLDPTEIMARITLHQRLANTTRELEESRRLLHAQTTLDTVTGLCARDAFMDHARRAVSFAVRHQTPLSLLLLDLDDFAAIQDHWGNEEADLLLAEIGGWLATATRQEDTVARLGEARFAVLAPQAGELGAAVLAERLRSGIAELALPIDGQAVQTTVSIGVANFLREPVPTVEGFMATAERRVAMARSRGHNQVCRRDDLRMVTAEAPEENPTTPAPPAVRPSHHDPLEAPTDDLVEQLIPLLQALTRQLGVEQLITDQGKAGPTTPP